MPTKQLEKIDITWGTFLRLLGLVFLVAAAYYLWQILAALLFAVVLASAIEPIVQFGRKYRVSRIISVIVIYALAAVFLIGVIYLALPAVVGELQNFISSYPIYQRELLREIQSFTGVPLSGLFVENRQELFAAAPGQLQQLAENTLALTVDFFGGVTVAVITIVVSFYLATQEKGIENFLRLIVPLEYEEYAVDLWLRAQQKLGQWLRAQALLGVIVGIMVYIALTLLDVRYSLVFAVLAAIFEVIPVIGPIFAAAPAVAVAFVQSPVLGLIIIAVYFVIQQIESHLIVPTVMRRTIGLNPLVVIIALLIGGKLGGVLGLLLAVPVASVLVEFLSDTDRKKRGVFQYGGNG